MFKTDTVRQKKGPVLSRLHRLWNKKRHDACLVFLNMTIFEGAESVYMNLRTNKVFKYFALLLFVMELMAPSMLQASDLQSESEQEFASVQIHSGVTPLASLFTETDSEERDSHEDDDQVPVCCFFFSGYSTFDVLPFIHEVKTGRVEQVSTPPMPLYRLHRVFLI